MKTNINKTHYCPECRTKFTYTHPVPKEVYGYVPCQNCDNPAAYPLEVFINKRVEELPLNPLDTNDLMCEENIKVLRYYFEYLDIIELNESMIYYNAKYLNSSYLEAINIFINRRAGKNEFLDYFYLIEILGTMSVHTYLIVCNLLTAMGYITPETGSIKTHVATSALEHIMEHVNDYKIITTMNKMFREDYLTALTIPKNNFKGFLTYITNTYHLRYDQYGHFGNVEHVVWIPHLDEFYYQIYSDDKLFPLGEFFQNKYFKYLEITEDVCNVELELSTLYLYTLYQKQLFNDTYRTMDNN